MPVFFAFLAGLSLSALGGLVLAGCGGALASALVAVALIRRRARRQPLGTTSPQEKVLASSAGFDGVPAQLIVQDLSAVYEELKRLRAAGLKDVRDKLREQPDILREWFRLVRVVAANRRSVEESGSKSVDAFVADFAEHMWALYLEAFRIQLIALWDYEYRRFGEDEFTYIDSRGQSRGCLMRFLTEERAGLPDWARTTVLIVDTTTAERTMTASYENLDLMRTILGRANILIWWARVQLYGGRFHWQIKTPKSTFNTPIYRLAESSDRGGLWGTEQVPDSTKMDALAIAALTEGRPGYQQEFRVLSCGQTHWVSEDAMIQKITDTEWSIVGVVVDVTQQHAVRELQQRSAMQIRQIMERADCMVWEARVTDVEGKLAWRFHTPPSGLQKRILGAVDAMKPDLFYRISEVPDLPEMTRNSEEAIRRGDPGYDQEFRMVKAPGETFWLHEQVSITPDGPGCWNLIGVTVDVTSRHAAEEARRAVQAQMDEILRRADCLLWQAKVVQTQPGLLNWEYYIPSSVLYREIFGADPIAGQDFLWREGETIVELPEMKARCRQALAQNEPSYEQEFRVVRPGRTFYLHEQVTINRLGPNEWTLVGVIVDISEKRVAEEALAAEKERLTVTLRAMTEGVITMDALGVVQYINRAAAGLTQWSVESAVGRKFSEVCEFRHADTGALIVLPLSRVFKEAILTDLPASTVLKGCVDRTCLVEGSFAPVLNASSCGVGAVLVFRDVTERHRLEEKMQRATKMESVGLLAGGIAHDFNNILTAIMGNIALAKLDVKASSEVERVLDEAQRATARAKDLTQQLLTFAKGGDPVRASLLVPQIITDAANFALHGSRSKCEIDIPDDLRPVNADRGQISQVVQNLVLNAVQAMPDGGTLRIVARNQTFAADAPPVLAPGDYVRIAVVDTGAGIKPEHLARIFDPYFTTKTFGYGLGLATVYSIVKKHQGHIEVVSKVGQGSTFTVWLPVSRERPVEHLDHTSTPFSRLKGRVLFMDDEETIVRMTKKMLQRLGLEMEAARDGREAVQKYRDALAAGKRFDLVIMDLTIPGGIGGKEAIGLLREIDPSVKAVVSSGYSSDPILADFRAHGFNGMVAKPYHLAELARVLNQVLGEPPRPV